MKLRRLRLRWVHAWPLALMFAAAARAESPPAEAEEFFEREVRPLLVKRCVECHGADVQEAGLRLDVRAAIEHGGESGPVVIPGKPAESRLIQVVGYHEKVQMPPDGKMPDTEIALLNKWIENGAIWPADNAPETGTPRKAAWEAEAIERAKLHWAFQPVQPQPVPLVKNTAWVQSPVDAFVLSKLEAAGLEPNPPVDRRTLIRRVTYDLIGLPPTLAEVEEFVADPAGDAYPRLVERLLASPRYGERWGRHWLDVARYADTKGYVGVDAGDVERREYPFAYRYRDWVIKSFNDDLPYDQFLLQQIAADKLPLGEDKAELAALGFFRMGRVFNEIRADQIDDRIDVLMRGTQGLTVACARCHDHKFDPIPTQDYYSLFGVFQSTKEPDDAERKLMLLADADHPENVRVFKRGNPANLGEEAPRRFLAVLSPSERAPFSQGSGRLELAQAIASRENPLTARVWVNRVWAHHWGAPLVNSTSDFGIRTERPVQADLLDFLADRFMAGGWSLKNLHRLILLSNTYQQSSGQREAYLAADSDNRLLWKANRRRLDFEQMRDSLLAITGELDPTAGGPSVELTVAPFSTRRAVYGRVDRQNLPGLFRTFDFANPDTHSSGRFQTSVPQQGLFALNDPFLQQRAVALVARLDGENISDPETRVERLYQWIFARSANEQERSASLAFVTNNLATNDFGPWKRLAQALLISNEFVFID